MPIFKNCAYFSVMSLALNDNIGGGNVINSHTRNLYWTKDDRVLAGKRELSLTTLDMPFMIVKCFVSDSTVYLCIFVKMLLCNPEEYIVFLSVYF